jgi:hypothetical protein
MLQTAPSDIIAYVRQFLGVKEVGNNSGFSDPVFEALMKKHGWRSGEPWCASLCRAVWLEIYYSQPFYDELSKILSKSVIRTYQEAKDSSLTRVQQTPVEGGIILWGTGNGKGHEGLVERVIDPFFVHSFEGNTTRSGVREGDTLMQKHRKLQQKSKWNKDWNYLGTIVPPEYVIPPTHLEQSPAIA